MSIITLLEKLATNPHYKVDIILSNSNIPSSIKKIFLKKDAKLLRKKLSNVKVWPDQTAVVKK